MLKDNKKQVEQKLREELQKQDTTHHFLDEKEVEEKFDARKNMIKTLVPFIHINRLHTYTYMDANALAAIIFETLYSLREEKGESTYSSKISDEDKKFNYIFKSYISIKNLVKNSKEAKKFFEEGLCKCNEKEFERWVKKEK